MPVAPPSDLTGDPTTDSSTELADKAAAVCRMGSLMLTAGTGSYRVKAAMGRVGRALGIDRLDVQVSLNELVVTTGVGAAFRTQVVEVPVPAVNAGRINQLMRLSLVTRTGVTPAQLDAQLDEVERRSPQFATWVVVLAAMVGCAGFTLLNNGRWQECLGAAVAAGLGKVVQVLLSRRRVNHLVVVFAAALVASACYVAAATIVAAAFPGVADPLRQSVFTCALFFLVPGFPLVTAALDLARFDFVSGISRLLYCLLITIAAALGAWVVAFCFGMTPVPTAAPVLPTGWLLVLHLVASFVGVFGFAVTFQTPPRAALVAAVIGMLANTARLASMHLGLNTVLATVAASTIVGLLAGWASQRLPCPRIILSVPAVLIMVPGASTYRALLAVINDNPGTALSNGMTSLNIVVALTGGLAVARMLTDPAWTQANPTWTGMPRTRAQDLLRRRARAGARAAREKPTGEEGATSA